MKYQPNLTVLFNNILSKDINKSVIGFKDQNKWIWKSRKDLKINILNCIDVLKDRKVDKFDRIMYKGKNCFEWVSWYVATNALGGIWVPLYDNQGDDYVNHIINDCNPKLFITDKKYKDVNCISNAILKNNFNNSSDKELPINSEIDIAKLIYTSGTTGSPKGVILTHENIISNYESINTRFSDFKNKDFTTLNILPWAHIYGLTAELYYNILNGNKIAISSGKDNFVSEIKEIKPDLLYLVPRILELIKSKVEFLDKPFIKCILPIILKKIFGSNLLTIFVGGAMLDKNTKQFYVNNNIILCEGYGCTETSPMISVNHIYGPNRNIHSIGKIMDNLVVKIIDDEILVSGPSIMKGYWNNLEATNKVIKKIGDKYYYKTGDQGYVQNDFLFYTGRISENYKLNNGKFVSVSNVENIVKKYLKTQFVVYGDNKPYNILISEKQNIITEENLNKINKDLDNYLKIKRVFYIENETFSNYLTPKLSLKRNKLLKDLQKIVSDSY